MKTRLLKLFAFLFVSSLLLSSCDFTKAKATNSSQDIKNYEGVEIPAKLENTPEQILHRIAYTVSYNKETKIPNWVAWKLTKEHCEGDIQRPTSAFHEDKEVSKPRATLADYKGSGWSRGHMCPAGDNKWDADAMYESFLLTNMCPQDSKLNAGRWNDIESLCRKWAKEYGEVYIVCGPILYKQKHKTIGNNKVVIPEAFFKVVLCLSGEPKAIGFICKNNGEKQNRDYYVNTVDNVERITGIDFFPNLDDAIENKIEAKADLKDWAK